MDRGFTPQQFVGLFDARHADRHVLRFFESEFGPLGAGCRGINAVRPGVYKKVSIAIFGIICSNYVSMEVVIDYETLKGLNDEPVVKELSLAADNVAETFHFANPHKMAPHGDADNGLNWADGYIPYEQLFSVLSEAVAGYAHLYAYGTSKCAFLTGPLGRTVINLQEFGCPSPTNFRPKLNCSMPCHKFPNIRCATKHAHSYDWLL
jgi:hypothetical protein